MSYAQKIITRCGGVRALARDLGAATSTVGSWARRGSIPDEAKATIKQLSDAKGYGLTLDDFFPVELLPDPQHLPAPADKDEAA
jgi:hypothetical protein